MKTSISVLSSLLGLAVATITGAQPLTPPTIDLVALPGPGYTVAAEGKMVTVSDPGSTVQMELLVSFPGYLPGQYTGLLMTYGVILSSQSAGGAIWGSGLTCHNTALFSVTPAYNGKLQDLNGDGLLDVGISGEPTGTPPTWVATGGLSADWLRPNQQAVVPDTPLSAPGNEVLSVLSLSGIELNPSPSANSITEYNFIPRRGAGNHAWYQSGIAANGIPNVGPPVQFVSASGPVNQAPEQGTLLCVWIGVLISLFGLHRSVARRMAPEQ